MTHAVFPRIPVPVYWLKFKLPDSKRPRALDRIESQCDSVFADSEIPRLLGIDRSKVIAIVFAVSGAVVQI
jgi:hypothetical protein